MVFRPAVLAVSRGDTLVWVNQAVVPHTVTARDASWDSGELRSGESFRLIVNEVGTIGYLCRYHPTMAGTLEVR